MRELVFVDTETTGLDSYRDNIVELSYCTLNTDPKTLYFGVDSVPSFIDNLIGFSKRGISGKKSDSDDIDEFKAILRNNTMVAANPSFDKSFLEANGLWTGHYRMLDIESYSMTTLGFEHVPSLKEIYEKLEELGFEVTTPEHTSMSDVMCLRNCYNAIFSLNETVIRKYTD